jgi:hypothetical protein
VQVPRLMEVVVAQLVLEPLPWLAVAEVEK